MRVSEVLRIQAEAEFTLHWSTNNWQSWSDNKSSRNSLEIDYVDIEGAAGNTGITLTFTFFWTTTKNWEGRDYEIRVR